MPYAVVVIRLQVTIPIVGKLTRSKRILGTSSFIGVEYVSPRTIGISDTKILGDLHTGLRGAIGELLNDMTVFGLTMMNIKTESKAGFWVRVN